MSKYGRQPYDTLKSNKLTAKKKFGQNFLVNRNTAEAIVRAGNLTKQDIVLEVGVGLGALTTPLAETTKHVVAYEIDSGIVRLHNEEQDLPENVTLIHQDILKADFNYIFELCGGPIKVMANLPYSISNPFIFKLIENAHLLNSVTVMLQKEVAERLSAVPSTKDYGVPTILLGSCATVEKKLTLKPGEFHPRPKVDSVVIHIDFSKTRLKPDTPKDFNRRIFTKIVRTTFNQRRKTIANTLKEAGVFGRQGKEHTEFNKEMALQALHLVGLSPQIRPETLDIDTFIMLTKAIEDLCHPALP
jgi:16S rRNA (adenine1518-N6/adenine1519-N6)-dimethyltransferase